MKKENGIVVFGAVIGLVAVGAIFLPGDAEAFFGDSDSTGNWFNDGVGAMVTEGTGKGKGSAEGNFSMNINASGKADTYVYSDFNGEGTGDVETHASGNEYDQEFYRYY